MDLYEEENEWKVYLNNGFGEHHGQDKAGDEITVGKSFVWNNALWHVPAVYVCKAGLVVDYCIEVEPDKIKQFVKKWEAAGGNEERLSAEEREMLESENPLKIEFNSSIVVNGAQLRRRTGYSKSWIPENCRPEGVRNDSKWGAIMNHYQLDPQKGWVIHRDSYIWDFKRKPVIKSLQVNLEQRPVPITAMKFRTPEKGGELVFKHPVTGIEHTVAILEIEKQEFDQQRLTNDKYEYPTHFTMMSYTLTPELSASEFMISDCLQSDSPKRKSSAGGSGACAIGIIAGADGPTAVFLAKKQKEPQLWSACSGLRFEPVDEVEWKAVCRIKLCEDMMVELI